MKPTLEPPKSWPFSVPPARLVSVLLNWIGRDSWALKRWKLLLSLLLLPFSLLPLLSLSLSFSLSLVLILFFHFYRRVTSCPIADCCLLSRRQIGKTSQPDDRTSVCQTSRNLIRFLGYGSTDLNVNAWLSSPTGKMSRRSFSSSPTHRRPRLHPSNLPQDNWNVLIKNHHHSIVRLPSSSGCPAFSFHPIRESQNRHLK